MTALREAAQQALEALEGKRYTACGWKSDCDKAIATLRAALAEPVQQGCDHCNHPLYAATKCRVCGRVTEVVQEPDDKAASIRWQLCLLAQTEEFSDDVRNQIGRGVWLIDRLCAALAEPVQEPVQEPVLTVDALRVEFERRYRGKLGITRVEGGAYLSPAIETEWQQFVRKHTAPPQRKPLTEGEAAALIALDHRMLKEFGTAPSGAAMELIRRTERAHGIGGEE